MTSATQIAPAEFAAVFRDQYVQVYRHMLAARLLEDRLAALYRAGGKIVGGVYLGRGQEAFSAALGAQLIKGKDIFGGLIRDQAGRMAFGEAMIDTTRTYLGSALGPMRGRDGNIHRGRPQEGMPAMISHLGAMVSVISGMLLARRLQGRLGDAVGATCIGDGGTSTGAFHEGLNTAAVERLPVIVAVANNQFAYSTPTSRQYACENLVERARGYGVEGYAIDGTDLAACIAAFQTAIQRARAGHGPQMIVGTLLRLAGHGEHDDASYIPADVKKGPLSKDCIATAEQTILNNAWMNADEVKELRDTLQRDVDKAFAQATHEPKPDPYKENWNALSTDWLAESWEVI